VLRSRRPKPAGITLRHRRGCPWRTDGCTCSPAYQAMAWSADDDKPIRKTFRTLTEAKAWRQDKQVEIRRGLLRAPTATTLGEAAESWLSAARTGVIRT